MTIIDDLPDNLPETPEKIERAFQDCQKEKREIVKTRTFLRVDPEEYKNYIQSALEALKAAQILFDNECYGWVVVPAYSAIYQAGNAVLIKELGQECRDHFCLLISLLKAKKIGWTDIQNAAYLKQELERISDEDIKYASKLRLARSAVIYKPADAYNEKLIAAEVLGKARSFVNNILRP